MTDDLLKQFLPLPHLALHVLLALADGDDRHGWALVRRIEDMTEDAWSPSAGSLYLAMTRLEKQGLIREALAPADETDARRRCYSITANGRRVLQARLERLAALVARGRRDGVPGLLSEG
jgi:DNA-binding PadR family transcriptional regulator